MAPVLMLSDHLREYCDGLRQCETRERLLEFLLHWAPFAADAYNLAIKFTDIDFIEFRQGLLREKSKKFAGKKWGRKYQFIVFPDVLFEVALIADGFKAPWGMAFLRMLDVGMIKETDGIYWVDREWEPEVEQKLGDELPK